MCNRKFVNKCCCVTVKTGSVGYREEVHWSIWEDTVNDIKQAEPETSINRTVMSEFCLGKLQIEIPVMETTTLSLERDGICYIIEGAYVSFFLSIVS